ncbi:MAG: hypothetical protein AABY09_01125 [Nanoarchaeota archaeon]
MPDKNQKNFLISIIASVIIFVLSFLFGNYVFRFGKAYGLSTFFLTLIFGLIIFMVFMNKYRK